jgi:hypothetical protein
MKKLRVKEASSQLLNLIDLVTGDMRQILHSQRRHILANLLRHGAASIGGE